MMVSGEEMGLNSSTVEGNNTFSFNFNTHENGVPFFETALKIERVFVPFICAVGLVGNTLATVVFLRKSLRNTSCSLCLAARSTADNGFLLTLFLLWLKQIFNLELGHISGLCQFVLFLTYVCGFVSVWMVVLVTIENYLRICHPFLDCHIYSTKTAKSLISLFSVTGVVIYNFPFWILTSKCIPIPQYMKLTVTLVYADTVLTLVVPTIVMAVLLMLIVLSLVQSHNRRKRLRVTPLQKRKNGRLTAKVTKMLFAVSMVYFVLNLPSHIIRLTILINTYSNEVGVYHPSLVEQGVQKLFQLIFYMSFSVNIFVYLSFGERFRNAFCDVFWRKQRTSNQECVEAVNLSSYSNFRRFSLTDTTNNDMLLPVTRVAVGSRSPLIIEKWDHNDYQ